MLADGRLFGGDHDEILVLLHRQKLFQKHVGRHIAVVGRLQKLLVGAGHVVGSVDPGPLAEGAAFAPAGGTGRELHAVGGAQIGLRRLEEAGIQDEQRAVKPLPVGLVFLEDPVEDDQGVVSDRTEELRKLGR